MVDVVDSKAVTSTNVDPRLPLDFSRVSGYTVFQDFPSSLLSSLLSPGLSEELPQKAWRHGTHRKDTCRCDGIGRRSGFKIRRGRLRVGSSPTTGTTSEQALYRLLRLFSRVRACSCRCSSFPNRTRYAGLQFGFEYKLRNCSIYRVAICHVAADVVAFAATFLL